MKPEKNVEERLGFIEVFVKSAWGLGTNESSVGFVLQQSNKKVALRGDVGVVGSGTRQWERVFW